MVADVIGEGGYAAQISERLGGEHGLVRLVTLLGELTGALDRLATPGGVLDRVLAEDALLDRLLTEDGFVDKLVAEGGTLDQLLELGATLERIQPRLQALEQLIPSLQESADALQQAVGPLGDLAGRLPGTRKRAAAR